jgi:hypothetical protein
VVQKMASLTLGHRESPYKWKKSSCGMAGGPRAETKLKAASALLDQARVDERGRAGIRRCYVFLV